MATRYSNINLVAYNRKQLRQAAVEVGVVPAILHRLDAATLAGLKAAILAL